MDWALGIYEIDDETGEIGDKVTRSQMAYLLDCQPIGFRDATFIVNLVKESAQDKRLFGPPLIQGFTCNSLRKLAMFLIPTIRRLY